MCFIQVIGFLFRVVEVIHFFPAGQIIRPVALVMMAGSLIGGLFGGRLAGSVNPSLLRWIVVVVEVVLAVIYFLK